MKKMILFFGLILIISGCATHKFIITSDVPEALIVSYNDEVKGLAHPDSTLKFSVTVDSTENYIIRARNSDNISDPFLGYIEYGFVEGDSIRQILNSENAKETGKLVMSRSNITRSINFLRTNEKKNYPDRSGYIKLTSNQKNVDIYFDNELVGQIIDDKPFNKKVPVGNHVIMAKKEFFMPYTISVDILEKSIFPFHFEMQNVKGWVEETPGTSTIRQARGNLTIATERNDYKVYIEGYEKIPPFELKDMPAGKYNLRIVRPGFEKTISVSVDDGEDKFVDLDELF